MILAIVIGVGVLLTIGGLGFLYGAYKHYSDTSSGGD